MSDSTAIEAIADAFVSANNDGVALAEDYAEYALAALRADGFEIYRPDECMETVACAHCVTASIPLEHRMEPFYLVPVGGED